MPSLTPLHENYCKLHNAPLSQADLLEGLAQLFSGRIIEFTDQLFLILQREVMLSFFGVKPKRLEKLNHCSYIEKLQQLHSGVLQHYSQHLLAPGLRHVLNRFPTLHDRSMTPTLQFLVGILNGILGDYLYNQHNPLALPMLLYDHYSAPQQGDLDGRIVIFIHGLCMNHQDWHHRQDGGIGEKLLAKRDHNTMLYLSYNSGRRISANGRSLAALLEDLVQRHPRITSIDLIGHSMGGLVARSALFYGKQNLHRWFYMVENLVCIGSPHHGAGLERFSYTIQKKVGHFPVVKLFSHFVNIRSNGILDLRHGSVRDDDWEHNEMRIGLPDDNRKPAPLPRHINTFLIAGTLEYQNKNTPFKILGDYLVSVKSALGEHPNPRYCLKVPDANKAVFYGLTHFSLQHHPRVAEQICQWFYPTDETEVDPQRHEYHLDTLEGIALT